MINFGLANTTTTKTNVTLTKMITTTTTTRNGDNGPFSSKVVVINDNFSERFKFQNVEQGLPIFRVVVLLCRFISN